jgi:hypothetical protein
MKGIHDQGCEFQGELVAPHSGATTFEEFLHMLQEIRDCTTHDHLQKDFFSKNCRAKSQQHFIY